MDKKWLIKPTPPANEIEELSAKINVNPVLSTLLIQRGIKDYEEAKKFFRPSLEELHDPFLMKDMDKAVERLSLAISNGEKILIYGDYDVDGTTSIALFFGFLRKIYSKAEYYVPDRYSEGYGVSFEGVDYARDNGFSLIICIDCGIKDVKKIAYAKSLEVDFIICDHHNPGDELPMAVAALDPKREGCKYPFKELSGCGVAFKFLQAFCIQHTIDQSGLFEMLDLLAVSIAADIVPIVGENRIFTHFGLIQINSDPKPGLKALIEISGMKTPLEVSNLVFGLGPRINAAGRIDHARYAVDLLLAQDYETAVEMAAGINKKNTLRKDFDSSITQEALDMIESSEWLRNAKSTVLFKDDWHKGVVGIVASRCIEKYYRPTIILTSSNNKATGSARSVHGFDVYEAISECAEYLDQFGGHMYAAGLTLSIDKIPGFQQKFEEVVSRRITEDQLVPIIEIDAILTLDQVNARFYKVLNQMAPFGPKNMEPVFISEDVEVVKKPVLLKNEHVKLTVKQGNSKTFDVLGFFMKDIIHKNSFKEPITICYTVCENNYLGIKSLQLNLKDIKIRL